MPILLSNNVDSICVGNKRVQKVYVGNDLKFCDGRAMPYVECSSPNPFFFRKGSLASGVTLQTSTNLSTWTNYTVSTEINAVLINGLYRVYLRGTGNTNVNNSSTQTAIFFGVTGQTSTAATDVRLAGNLEALLEYSSVNLGTHPTMGTYAFYYLFNNNTSITDCSNLALGTLSVPTQAYYYMFRGCTNLTKAPKIYANEIGENGCGYMFMGCTNLVDASHPIDAILGTYSCEYMFYNCPSLTKPPKRVGVAFKNVDTSSAAVTYCCYYMFGNCTALNDVPELPAINFYDVSPSTSSGNSIGGYAYYYMFYNCTSLNKIPELPAKNLARYCYAAMFNGCTALNKTPILPAMTIPYEAYYYMFYGCTSLTTPPRLPATTIYERCYYRMFYNCKALNKLVALPATTITAYCYYQMFYGCSNIKVSSSQTGAYNKAYRIPITGSISSTPNNALSGMFTSTGGTYTSTPSVNTNYYTSNEIVNFESPILVDSNIDDIESEEDFRITVKNPNSYSCTLYVIYSSGNLTFSVGGNSSIVLSNSNASDLQSSVLAYMDGELYDAVNCWFYTYSSTVRTTGITLIPEVY